MRFEDVKNYCEENNFTSRASRYEIMEKYFGIGAGTIKDVLSFDRYLRYILDVDEVGLKKESEYHKSPYLFEIENRSKKLQKDLLKFS